MDGGVERMNEVFRRRAIVSNGDEHLQLLAPGGTGATRTSSSEGGDAFRRNHLL